MVVGSLTYLGPLSCSIFYFFVKLLQDWGDNFFKRIGGILEAKNNGSLTTLNVHHPIVRSVEPN